MTAPFEDDDWGRPVEFSGEYARPETLINHLIIVMPIGYVEHSITRFSQPGKKSDAIVCDVIDLEDTDPATGQLGKVYRSTWLRQAQIIASLKTQIGKRILGRFSRGVPRNGMNAPWVIVDMSTDPNCVQHARNWLQANPTFAPSAFRAPDPVAVAPAPAPSAPPAYPPQQQGYAPPYGQPYSAAPPPGYQPPAGPPPQWAQPQGSGYMPGYPPPAPPQQAPGYPPQQGGWEPQGVTGPNPPQQAPGYPPQQPPPPPQFAPPPPPQQYAPAPPPAAPTPPAGYPAGVTDLNTLEAMRQRRAQSEQQGYPDNPPF